MAFPSPSLTPPSLADWQMSYGGLTFGQSTAIKIQKVEGLDLATIQHGDVQRPRDHGQLIGLDVYGGRDVTLDLEVVNDGTSLASALSSLAAATGVGLTTEQPLWFQIPGMPLLAVMCRARKRTIPMDAAYATGQLAIATVQFHATDPRIYSAGTEATVGLPTPTSGLTFPATFPISFGATGPNGVVVSNNGNSPSMPLLVITGPVTNPAVTNASVTGSPTVKLSNPSQTSYTVLAGDQLIVDLDLKTVLYYSGGVASGTAGASRRSWVVWGSEWWALQPGSNLIQFLSGDPAAVAGTCTIEYASAYQL